MKADGVIGDSDTNIIGINPNRDVNDQSGRLSVSGTWQTWKSRVAKKARVSSIFMFAICVALAAPLLRIIGHQSFSICIAGRTRIGKTIATLIGASVRGIGQTGDLISWNLTEDRLEQRLVEYNDSVFPIDDLNNMRDSERDRYDRIENVAYLVEQGHQKGRHTSFAKAHGAAQKWRVILLTSHEHTIAELAGKLKRERREGSTVRLSDLPATFNGLRHIFDRLKKPLDKTIFRRRRDNHFKNIARACAENHGAVFERYIDRLIFHGHAKVREYVLRQIEFFVGKVGTDTDGDIARDVARNFGIIYAAGMLGIKLEFLPWTKEELLDAIAKCYRAARDLLPDDGVALRRGVQALNEGLRRLPDLSDLSDKTAEDRFQEIEGFRVTGPSTFRCLIRCETFNSIFASSRDGELVLDWLIQKGWITLAKPKVASAGSTTRPMNQHTWPDGERRRSYEIRWPRRSQSNDHAPKRRTD